MNMSTNENQSEFIMILDIFNKVIEEAKTKVGNIENYEFHLHSKIVNKLREDIEILSNTNTEIKNDKLFGFPVVVNDMVPPDKIYFIDGKALGKLIESWTKICYIR